jgi:hypothetical protein
MNGILSYPETGSEFSLADLLSGAVIECLIEFAFEGGLELLACLLDGL